MRKVAVALFVLVLLGGGVWLLAARRGPAKAPYSGPAAKISIANIGEFSIFNLVARDRGYFAARGLDAEVREYSAGPPAMAALLAGEVDVAIAADFVGVTNMFGHPELRVIAETSRHNVFSFIARVDRGVREPEDLRGKKIGVTRRSAGEFYLGRFLTLHNLSFDDVTVVDLPPEEIVAGLHDGTLQAGVTFNPHIYNLELQLAGNAATWSAQDTQKTSAVLYSTREFAQANPAALERYLRALADAEEYVRERPEEAKALLARDMGYAREYVEYSWPNFRHRLGLEQELLLSMEAQAAWLIANGLAEADAMPNYLDFIYFDALAAVKPESIHIIH